MKWAKANSQLLYQYYIITYFSNTVRESWKFHTRGKVVNSIRPMASRLQAHVSQQYKIRSNETGRPRLNFFVAGCCSTDQGLLEEATVGVCKNFVVNNGVTGNLVSLVRVFLIRADELKVSAQCHE